MPVRVLLFADDEIILAGLQGMLAPHRARVEVVGWALAAEELLSTVTEREAEVVLIDPQRDARGHEFVAGLLEREPPFRVVIFTNEADERRLNDNLRLGVSGYLLKSLNGPQLADLLVQARDEVAVDPRLATSIAIRAARQEDGPTWPGAELKLSRRESQVLNLLVDGLSNRMIATRLSVGEETVKTHLRSIYSKLGVNDRAQAVANALRRGVFA